MSHQVLARQWRPKTFDEVIGQSHVVQALTHALNTDHLHHAYLFTGTRGVGKTTLARIIAKCVNCEKGVSATPCGTCNACTEIDAGRFPDLLEVDAASRTKVEDTRDLLDNVQYAPTKGRYKIYLIDEVHMLSGHSFNALLKTLEEPPEHVMFLLATTDPQKLPATVLSRCLQFHLKQMPPEQIAQHLQTILKTDKIDFEEPATLLIGKAASGSMRDALSLLDQSIAFGGGAIKTADVESMLGITKPNTLYDILNALHANDANALLDAANDLTEQGADFTNALDALLSMLHQIAVIQAVQPGNNAQLNTLAKQLSPEDVQLYYQIGLIGQRDLPLSPTLRVGFDMTLLRMLSFTPNTQATKPRAASKPSTQTSSTATQTTASGTWAELLPQLNLTGPTLAIAQHCSLLSHTDTELKLALDPKQKAMLHQRHIDRIQEALKQHQQKDIKVSITVEAPSTPTPAKIQQATREQKQQTAESHITRDETVQRIMQTFDATIVKSSIQATDQQPTQPTGE